MIDFCIFFVTSKCNSRCKFCFYEERLNKPDDLKIEEIRSFSSKMPKFTTLLFSGGEPFLRDDLDEIVRIFAVQNRVRSISIPTNGINTGQIISMLGKIIQEPKNKGIAFSVSPSIDGMDDLDALLRGRPDAFSSVSKTLEELGRLKKLHKNLYISPNTVFSSDNAAGIGELIDFIGKLDFVDFHNLEAVRPKTIQGYPLRELDLLLLKRAHLSIARVNADRLGSRLGSRINIFRRLRYFYSLVGQIGYLRYAQSIKEDYLCGKKRLFDCPAGKSMCVIEANGDVRLCELRPAVGNLRENSYDLAKILGSSQALKERDCICNSACNCTHACFISEYINQGLKDFNPKTALRIIYHFIKFDLAERKNNRQ